MRQSEAPQYIGKPVTAFTSLWGKYVGILVEMDERHPYRAKVEIKAVLVYPHVSPFMFKGKVTGRKPLKYNFVLDVGAINVKPYDGEIPDYCESLKESLNKAITSMEELNEPKLKPTLEALYVHREYLIPEWCKDYKAKKEAE